jgi:GWxTD domain-containing protein
MVLRGLARPDGGAIEVVVKVSRSEMDFVRSDDAFHGTLQLYATIRTRDGAFVADATRKIERQLRGAPEAAWEGVFESIRVEFQVQPGEYGVEVIVKAPESDRTGVAQSEVLVRPFPSEGLALSEPVLMSFSEADSGFVADPQPGSGGSFLGPSLVAWEIYRASGVPDTLVTVVAAIDDEESLVGADTLQVRLEGSVTPGRWETDLSILPAGTYTTRVALDGAEEVTADFQILWSIETLALDKDDGRRLLEYFGTRDDEDRFKKLNPEERQAFWQDFWREHDPVPGTPRNEFRDAVAARIRYANDRFGSFTAGWKTDRGMVYVILGAPDEIERHPFEVGSKPYEIWSYYSYRVQYVFVDWRGFGNYELYRGPQPQMVIRNRG